MMMTKYSVMESKGRGVVVICILAVAIFGYTQYMSVSQVEATIIESNGQGDSEMDSEYDIKVKFDNPSLLVLTAGQTEFLVIGDDRVLGRGSLEAFTLNPLDDSVVSGTYRADSNDEGVESVWITGVTKYDVLVASIDVPFTYYPTDSQVMEFIHQG